MATLPAGYILQRRVPSTSSSGSLGFIVFVRCCRMVDNVPIRHNISIVANTVRPSVDAGEMIMPA